MITFYSQNVWNYNPSEYRNKLIRSLVSDFDADICSFQECGLTTNRVGECPLPSLMADTYEEVCKEFADRNFTPVFYKKEKFNLIDSGYVLYEGLNDVNSKSITLSSIPRYLIGSSPTIASSPNSAIPSLSSGLKNLLSTPSSTNEHSIPFDS